MPGSDSASNQLHLINPKSITNIDTLAGSYSITNVSPLLINNNDIVTVKFQSTKPSKDDWIGAYSPADVDIHTYVPVKFGSCDAEHYSTYLTNGVGTLSFNMTNLRGGIKFYYFINGTTNPATVTSSSQVVHFHDINEPVKNRVVATGDPNVLKLLWSTTNATSPMVKWGTSSGNYQYSAAGARSSISRSSLCSAPANESGWFDQGTINTASFTGIRDLGLSNKDIYYVFGDAVTQTFSKEKKLHVPPLAGTQPPTRATTVALLADLGIGNTDTSYDTHIWDEECPPAVNTTMSISALVEKGLIDAIVHTGDIAYANGYLASWDFFLNMISPMAGGALYLTTVGNHESDTPHTASLPIGSASGGECGILSTTLLPMPRPATTNQPWWSYDIGLIHILGMSTEHNYTIGSAQYLWIEQDLKAVDRTVTPWILFTGHRSMYVDSNYCCTWGTIGCAQCVPGSDVQTMIDLQTNIEELLHRYKVNLAFAGHFHTMNRQAAVYHNEVVQESKIVYDEKGNRVAYHDRPNATVYMVIGAAGNGPDFSNQNYSWSEKYWDNLFGYAIVSATNATVLSWQLINSANNHVMDRMIITQNDEPWVTTNSDSSSSSSNTLSSADIAIITVACVVVVGFVIALVMKFLLFPKTIPGAATAAGSAGSVTSSTTSSYQQDTSHVDNPIASQSLNSDVEMASISAKRK